MSMDDCVADDNGAALDRTPPATDKATVAPTDEGDRKCPAHEISAFEATTSLLKRGYQSLPVRPLSNSGRSDTGSHLASTGEGRTVSGPVGGQNERVPQSFSSPPPGAASPRADLNALIAAAERVGGGTLIKGFGGDRDCEEVGEEGDGNDDEVEEDEVPVLITPSLPSTSDLFFRSRQPPSAAIARTRDHRQHSGPGSLHRRGGDRRNEGDRGSEVGDDSVPRLRSRSRRLPSPHFHLPGHRRRGGGGEAERLRGIGRGGPSPGAGGASSTAAGLLVTGAGSGAETGGDAGNAAVAVSIVLGQDDDGEEPSETGDEGDEVASPWFYFAPAPAPNVTVTIVANRSRFRTWDRRLGSAGNNLTNSGGRHGSTSGDGWWEDASEDAIRTTERGGPVRLDPPLFGSGSARTLAEAVSRMDRAGAGAASGGGGSSRGARGRQSSPNLAGSGLDEDGAEGCAGPEIDVQERGTVAGLSELALHPNELPLGLGPWSGDDVAERGFRRYPTSSHARRAVLNLGSSIPRRVCQHPFRRNDIVWVCRTCQSDETCVLCHACYSASDHTGHDVAFYHAQAGGCCDCGDPDAWDPRGFCPFHGVDAAGRGEEMVGRARVESVGGCVSGIMNWMVKEIAGGAERGYRRANRGVVTDRWLSRGDSLPVDAAEAEAEVEEGVWGEATTMTSRSPLQRGHSIDGATADPVGTLDGMSSSSTSYSSSGESGLADMRNVDVPMDTGGAEWNIGTSDEDDHGHTHHGDDGLTFNPAAASASKSRESIGADINSGDDLDESVTIATHAVGTFDPEAASTSKSLSRQNSIGRDQKRTADSEPPWIRASASPALRLGDLGRRGRGLYLVWHADDVRRTDARVLALGELFSVGVSGPGAAPSVSPHSEAVLIKISRLVKDHSDLIVWGTHELIAEVGPTRAALWRDGDRVATEQVGKAMLDKARILSSHGLVCSIKTRQELLNEGRAAAVLGWLNVVAKSCDPLCHRVSRAISGPDHLVPMLRSDLRLPHKINVEWHSLLLTLLAVPDFKADLADAYCDTYRAVTAEYARGVGTSDRSSYTLSVQFLNRVTYVQDLVRERDLLGTLGRSLLETLGVAAILTSIDGDGHDGSIGTGSNGTSRGSAFRVRGNALFGGDFLSPWSRPGEEAADLERGRRVRSIHSHRGIRRRIFPQRMRRGGNRRGGGADAGVPSAGDQALGGVALSHQLSLGFDSLVPTLDPMNPVLTHRRYSPIVSDLKCVLNVPGMARLFASLPLPTNVSVEPLTSQASAVAASCLDGWVQSLALGQNMDGQVWRSSKQGHVETESRGWVGAFNASISLGSLFERLLAWEDGDPSPLSSPGGMESGNVVVNGGSGKDYGLGLRWGGQDNRLLSASQLATHVLVTGVASWQASESLGYRPTPNATAVPPHRRCPASLPFGTVSVKHGTDLAMRALPVAQVRPFSFHLPLHRFAAACLREVSRRPDIPGSGGIFDLLATLESNPLEPRRRDALLRGLSEFPSIVLSRAAQIRAGLWKRNGNNMQDQVLNYAEPPFCRALRDADLTLVQFAAIARRRRSPSPSIALVGGEKEAWVVDSNEEMTEDRKARRGIIDGNRLTKGERMVNSGLGDDTDVGCVHLVNLLLHRFGVFDFAGLGKAPNTDLIRYTDEVDNGLYLGEVCALTGPGKDDDPPHCLGHDDDGLVLPWTYTPAREASSLLALLEELLHLLIVLMTELPPPPPETRADHAAQARMRLRREVIHKLASGPKPHSELAEVHHVLPNRDNDILSEEGKLVNPDDATGAALEAVLAEVADRRVSRGRLAADHWELRRWAWAEYDPAFFHMSLRCHQIAAEKKPLALPVPASAGGASLLPPISIPGSSGAAQPAPRPYAPRPPPAHPSFERLRRDLTSDASIRTVIYRTLHVHCRKTPSDNAIKPLDAADLRGRAAYESGAMSETVLARALHLLTMGVYAWANENAPGAAEPSRDWRDFGGGGRGSIFFASSLQRPSASDWIKVMLLSEPVSVTHCDWYHGEEPALLLLHRLATDGGSSSGGFVAQDAAVRSGAAWIVDCAVRRSPEAAALLGGKADAFGTSGETELDRRKREAKERAMQRMKDSAAKFAATMQALPGEEDDNRSNGSADESEGRKEGALTSVPGKDDGKNFFTGTPTATAPVMGVEESQCSLDIPGGSHDINNNNMYKGKHNKKSSERLLKDRPRCIICVDDTSVASRGSEGDGMTVSGKGNGDALALCGYTQASMVLKGGGGLPHVGAEAYSDPAAYVSRFVGTHVTLCGHAVHSVCCEKYIQAAAQRDDRFHDRLEGGKRGEFKCPLCQRLSNCLVPFIDVGMDWVESPSTEDIESRKDESKTCWKRDGDYMDVDHASETDTMDSPVLRTSQLHSFLDTTRWWASRNDDSVVWDGRCSFSVAEEETPPLLPPVVPGPGKEDGTSSHLNHPHSLRRSLRRSVRSFGKKDLFAAWNAVMRTPQFVRRRHYNSNSRHSYYSGSDGSDGGSNGPSGTSTRSISLSSGSLPSSSPDAGSSSSNGVTEVWRKLMDQISEVSHRADLKRLGEEQLLQDYGEFRHFMVEKAAFNVENRAAGKEVVDWPTCISSTTLSENRRQELSREKLISKLLLSIQAFTYSCCSEAAEVRHLFRKGAEGGVATGDGCNLQKSLYSKFGISTIVCNGELILLPKPSLIEDEGAQPFHGRFGKLRYLALAVMVATSAVSREIVQLVFSFPLQGSSGGPFEMSHENDMHRDIYNEPGLRGPIAYSILRSHVLSHVVAAICATCGRARIRSDSLEPTSAGIHASNAHGENDTLFYDHPSSDEDSSTADSVFHDCEAFIRLGFLARILQILLGSIQCSVKGPGEQNHSSINEERVLETSEKLLNALKGKDGNECSWQRGCCLLLKTAISVCGKKTEHRLSNFTADITLEEVLLNACSLAKKEGSVFLADVAVLLQVLAPGWSSSTKLQNTGVSDLSEEQPPSPDILYKLMRCLKIESISDMLESTLVCEVVGRWYLNAKPRPRTMSEIQQGISPKTSLEDRLDCKRGFPMFDWPMAAPLVPAGVELTPKHSPMTPLIVPGEMSGLGNSSLRDIAQSPSRNGVRLGTLTPPVYSSKKSVTLLGGYHPERRSSSNDGQRPRIQILPTSYTDLYAELGALCPDSEQTALCLVCGQVLNAGGKGECTKHAYKCGGGSGIFFLLQECTGLIMHGVKAAYIHSPYVDSHGETPQYRGRPLNLDLDRYGILREMWSGHLVRERVISERANSRQVIIANFY